MYIYQIEIDNFKSFSGQTVIPFRKGFTTVSGPNGSGKSNIIDSILFCLGLSSSRVMRAEKLSDLVNNLSKRKEAKVRIVFKKEPHDRVFEEALDSSNSTQSTVLEQASQLVLGENAPVKKHAPKPELPAESALSQDFITVSRRIRESSSGSSSTYYLNEQVSTLTDIHEYLGRYNISPGCFNVMMQGDVAGFVNMSSVERRKIIDEIAGVAEFDRKIEQAQKELETTGANIERHQILLQEIETRLLQLSEEREHALKYQKIKEQKQGHENQLLGAKYLDIHKAIEATRSNIKGATERKRQVQEQLTVLKTKLDATQLTLEALEAEVKRKGEDQQIALKKQIESLKGHIARKEDSIRSLDDKRREGEQQVEKMTQDIQRQAEAMTVIDTEVAGFEHQLKELQALYENEKRQLNKLNTQFDQMTESTGQLSHRRGDVRDELTQAEDKLNTLNRACLDLESEIKRLNMEWSFRSRNLGEAEEKRLQLQGDLESWSRQLKEIDIEKAAFEAQLQQEQLRFSQARVALNTANSRLNELKDELIRLETKKRTYEEVNFARPVERVLSSGLKGIHGTLSQLGRVEADLSLALEVALGGRMQNVVVDDEQVAEKAIRLLQEQRAGRATFLPLSKLANPRALPALPKSAGVVDFAINLIGFDPCYDVAFAYALGDTLIVEDMAAARKLLRQYRMVTLDGSLMEKSGAMTGGSTPGGDSQKQAQRFANTQRLDEQLSSLQEHLDTAQLEKDAAQKKLTAIELKLEGLKAEYALCLQKHASVSASVDEVSKQIQAIPQSEGETEVHEKQKIQSHIQQLEETYTQQQKLLEASQAEVLTLKETMAALDAELPTEQIQQLRKDIEDIRFQMEHYDTQIRHVQADIKSKEMEKNYQQAGCQEYQTRIVSTKESWPQMEAEKQLHQEEIHLTWKQIHQLEAQTNDLDEELKKLQTERDQVRHQLLEAEKEKNRLDRSAVELSEQLNAFQSRLQELTPELTALKQQLLDLQVDVAALHQEEMPSEADILKLIQKCERQLEALEPVNMRAIQEFDEVTARQVELAEKIETLSRETQALTVRIAGYEELKLVSFKKAFEHVDGNFKAIFQELADGQGRLVLTNPEQPFTGGMTIEAQPRGKKMQRIEAMSGGEKSLTSLAFVFSLQRYLPAPFYALDEVDMNLDGINAEKLAHMVKRESIKGAQFIVVSLRKPMIDHSDQTVGVTQRKNGITKVTGVNLHGEELGDVEAINEVNNGSAA
ncbi:MAG: chromosome segregation protein SMC [Cyanobacteria bacterium]|nr:chromosome segregation protein SMC [Cyanobacteriota bacterium]